VSIEKREKREKRLLTVKELADYLRVNQTTIYRLLRRSEIPAFKVGGDWRFNLESIDEWRLNADSASFDRAAGAARRPLSEAVPSSMVDSSDATFVLLRIYEAISQLLGPIAEISRMLPAIKSIAEAMEDKRDTSGEIARLYEGTEIAFRTHWESLLKFVPTPFGASDEERRLVTFNDAYCQLFGFRRKHLRNMSLMDLVHHDDLDRFMALGNNVWERKSKSATFLGRRLTAKSDVMPTRSTAWLIGSTPGAPPQYLAAAVERIATSEEASALFARSADQLSKRREDLLTRA